MHKIVTYAVNARVANVFHVEQEPGDMTHYSYFVYRDGPDNFCFMPKDSTFKFPQRISWFEVQGDEGIRGVAQREGCNPCTVAACVETMKMMKEGER
jgi:hypothetical protein